ncbi:RHS repeat-associated core domain-containing protein [Paludibaculum fermentans]|uniref:RHS repeat-associated core domain-containing protein n=1 Tax=Paludibaculum fermentans TaxID=1473598 RepID=A0A7S7SNH2_PALFE|nr:RHS repeat-associated core domain-containing protein [Paludibaculum fermentans]QOY91464.1 RHS repeat-associated core domain-containing protein [Paludibaculum fermentans]
MTLNYGYDAMGQLQKVTSGSGPGVDLVNSATYNPAGQLLSSMRATTVGVSSTTDLPTGASLGLETFQYNGRNQLTEQTGLGTDINYWYSSTANDGRLAQKHNWVTGEEENYTYDSLGRLATAYTTGTQWGLSFVYDGFGDRLQQNVTKGTAPSTVQTVDTATNRLNGAGFGYDSNGNMTGWSTPSGSVTASYDIENRMTQIVTPSVTETYKYGPGNLRVKKLQGGNWTYTVYGQGGEVLGTYSVCTVSGSPFLCQAKLRVYFGGRLVLNGWTGVKPDRLGSPDGTHGRVYPYGEVSGAVTVDQDETFTTYKRDVYTGLDYAQNRYYASAWGRFTSADPYRASGGPEDPGSWNRYAYVVGDPISRYDPFGLDWWDAGSNTLHGDSDTNNGGQAGNSQAVGGSGVSAKLMPDASMGEGVGGSGSTSLETGGDGNESIWKPAGYNGASEALSKKDCYEMFGFKSAQDAQGAFGKVSFEQKYLGQLLVTPGPNGGTKVAQGTPPPAQAKGNIVSVNYNYNWFDFSAIDAKDAASGSAQTFNYLGVMSAELGVSLTTSGLASLILLHEFKHTNLGGNAPQEASNRDFNLPAYEKCIK